MGERIRRIGTDFFDFFAENLFQSALSAPSVLLFVPHSKKINIQKTNNVETFPSKYANHALHRGGNPTNDLHF